MNSAELDEIEVSGRTGSPESTHPGGISVGNIRPSAFLAVVAKAVKDGLNVQGSGFQYQVRSRLAKFWFGSDGSIHYELWLHERTSQLELGLHCEATTARNQAIYRHLDRSLVEIQARLGNSIWLEEWDHGWVRLYETQPLWPLDAARVNEVASRLAEVIAVVQPIYESTHFPLG